MYKFYPVFIFLLGVGLSHQALADCTSPLIDPAISVLAGSTVCTNDSQEEHRGGGQLWDYKKGDSDPVDPRSQVGNWSSAGSQVSYSYTGDTGGPYTFNLHSNGGNSYTLCGTNVPTIVDVTILATDPVNRVCSATIYDAPPP